MKIVNPIISIYWRSNIFNNLRSMDIINAIAKFDSGPAIDISAASRLGCFRLKGSNCTGFPHPNPIKSRKIIPYISIWAFGFSVNLPCSPGVGSPS